MRLQPTACRLPKEDLLAEGAQKTAVARQPRYLSHAIVEIRKFKHLPFFAHSAVLLDISLSGYKVEFTGEVQVEAGQKFWVNIPLTPLGIYAPSRLVCRAECRWFDPKRYRIGGVFIDLSATDRQVIQHVVETLGSRGGSL